MDGRAKHEFLGVCREAAKVGAVDDSEAIMYYYIY
jgi:hypothetical protein